MSKKLSELDVEDVYLGNPDADFDAFVEHVFESAPDGYEPSERFVVAVYQAFSVAPKGATVEVDFEPERIEINFCNHTIH